jgi:hypothetical protein
MSHPDHSFSVSGFRGRGVMVIAGCAIAIRRRMSDRGAIALQQFMLDFVPHMLLIHYLRGADSQPSG